MRALRHLSAVALIASFLPGRTGAQTPVHQGIVHNAAGSSSSVVNGVAADAQGNLIITGWRSDALDLGGMAHAQGPGAIFLAKFDALGNELWSKVSGSADLLGSSKGFGVAVDADGNIYNCGSINSLETSIFDGVSIPPGNLGFVAKYDPAGTLLWVEEFGGWVNAIAVDGNGNPFINASDGSLLKLNPANGQMIGIATGAGDLQNTLYHNIVIDGSNNVLSQWGNKIMKHDNGLNQLWSTPLAKPSLAESFRISVDDNGDVWATFYALFGTVTLGGTDYTNFPNGYIYKLSGADGSVLSCTSPGAYKVKKVFHVGGGELEVFGDFAFNQPALVKYDAALTSLWSVPTFDTKDAERIGTDCFVTGGQHSADIVLDGTTYARPNGSGQENAIAGYLCAGDVGMPEQQAATRLIPYPVPTADLLRVDLPVNTRSVRVMDASGAEVLTHRAAMGANVLDVRGLVPGAYLLLTGQGVSARFCVLR